MAPARAEPPEEEIVIQKYLADLYLGDSLEQIKIVYPPAAKWTSYREPRGGVDRIHIRRSQAKRFPPRVEALWLGLRKDRLVEIWLIYDADYSSEKSAEALASDLALIYGEPRRTGGRFWWTDGERVIRVINARLPALSPEREEGVELRTSIQLITADLFHRKRDG